MPIASRTSGSTGGWRPAAAEEYRGPGGAGRAAAGGQRWLFEESPDSTGQDAGESQAGATSRRGNRKQTASRGNAGGKGATVG